jgi:hypothetical protein
MQFPPISCLILTLGYIYCVVCYFTVSIDHAIAQEVICWLLKVVAWVQYQNRSFDFCGQQNGIGAGLSQVLQFPMLILTAPNAQHLYIIWGWKSRPDSGEPAGGPSLTAAQELK